MRMAARSIARRADDSEAELARNDRGLALAEGVRRDGETERARAAAGLARTTVPDSPSVPAS